MSLGDWVNASQATFEIELGLLNLEYTLDCGQAFRWRRDTDGWWTGVVRGHIVRLRRDGATINGQVYPPVAETDAFLSSYLRLDVDLRQLCQRFAEVDPWISAAVSAFAGLRVLNQEPQETLLSYVCSAANSVPRISRSVEEMSRRYGEFVGCLEDTDYYAFPTPDRLAAAPMEVLANECGLGWRAAILKRVAAEVVGRPEGWPEQLRRLPYREARAMLMELRGIGAKIADCVCLFALGKDEAVPVDTHIWAVAREIFRCKIATRTLSPATYETVASMFVERYGGLAGWAQEYFYLQRRAAQGRVAWADEDTQLPSPFGRWPG